MIHDSLRLDTPAAKVEVEWLNTLTVGMTRKSPLFPALSVGIVWTCTQATSTRWVFEGSFCGVSLGDLILERGETALTLTVPREASNRSSLEVGGGEVQTGMPDLLGYCAADTLGMILFQVEGRLTGSVIHKLRVGPWQVDLSMQAGSDLLTGKEVTLLVWLAAHLPLYFIIRDAETWILVLDPVAVQGVVLDPRSTVRQRLTVIKPAIRGIFSWKDKQWKQLPVNGVRF
ncbi:MAG: hypothetical protein C5B54_10190 [Acidobacteria bacterium]|nr:MAG: hypothetical protein C5B54_10190 [Acidobacteriota bacterium]